jgi:hypothetical protein
MNRLLAICFILVSACSSRNHFAALSTGTEQSVDSLPGQCPYLTKDNKGHAVLSWVRMMNDSSAVFCYAVSPDGGKLFGHTVTIPSSTNIQPHGENLPKIIFKPSGEIIALWGAAHPNPANKYSGLVFYSQSFDNGKSWTNAKILTTDTASFDQRYYDVALLADGEAAIIWLDNRKTTAGEGSALYFAKTSGKNGFTAERLISQPCCPCCRTDLFVDSKNGIHVLYRGIIQDSIRDMMHAVSMDGGKTFSSPERISKDNWVINACPHTGPAMTENEDGLHFSWFTGGNHKGSYYTNSSDNGKTFSAADSISTLGSHPQMTALDRKDIVIVWDESMPLGNPGKKIGIEKRDGDGQVIQKDFLTPDNFNCSFPVVTPVSSNATLVAYSEKQSGKNYIRYRMVSF